VAKFVVEARVAGVALVLGEAGWSAAMPSCYTRSVAFHYADRVVVAGTADAGDFELKIGFEALFGAALMLIVA